MMGGGGTEPDAEELGAAEDDVVLVQLLCCGLD
jgi:hypothetical protein